MLLIPEWNWQGFMPWVWLAVMLICFVVEAFTMSLTTVWFAAGALVLVFVSMLPVPVPVQLLLFALISVLLLVFTRPIALRFLKIKRTATNSDALIGSRCTLLKAVTEQEKGAVRLKGMEWAVESEDGRPIGAGTDCVVKEIKGNTLIVTGV